VSGGRIKRESRILIIDDDPQNVLLLERMLEWAGFDRVYSASDPTKVSQRYDEVDPDLVLLDLHMPHVDGFQVLEILKGKSPDVIVPVLVFTADVTREAKEKALKAGAHDFLTKPGDPAEIVLRVNNFLHVRRLQQELVDYNMHLEKRVAERTQMLATAYQEVLDRLALAAEFRDDETGEHAQRVGDISAAIAAELGFDEQYCALIRSAARLHDIGKIGVADAILLKKSTLTKEEFLQMQLHTVIGSKILANGQSELIKMAEVIARTHHEKWDGNGYHARLKADEIPIEGRIVAVADVYDALTSERPYKPAWTTGAALTEIQEHAGTSYDPTVVDALMRVHHSAERRRAA
jgi:putative two-component system response regulator